MISVCTSVCLLGPKSTEVSDMAAVFTRGLKVNISELFFFYFWISHCTLNTTHNTLNCVNGVKHCTHDSHTSSILILTFWFIPTKAALFGDRQQTSFFTHSKWGESPYCMIKPGQNSPGWRQRKRNQMRPKTSEIRARADVINLVVSGERSGWTHNCWPAVGWLIINCGCNRTVPVRSAKGSHVEIGFFSDCNQPYSPIEHWRFYINCWFFSSKKYISEFC